MKAFGFSEAELRELFVSQASLDKDIDVFIEVPAFCRSVDLVIEDKKNSKISAVEFKLHDWRRALQQVQTVGICFDYLYICLPRPKTNDSIVKISEACDSVGVGLIFYEVETKLFVLQIAAKKTFEVWDRERHRIVEYLEARRDETRKSENPKI